jgi:acetyl-CoA decarbonylase/synthase complex subunit delta
MAIPDVKEKWTGKINEVTIGATKEEGGTRGKVVQVGGQTTLPFLNFEGDIPNKPVIAGFISDTVPDWPDAIKNAIGGVINSPVEWAQKNVQEYKTDLISLKFIGADPNVNDASPADCAKVVEDVLKAVDVPLIIWGCGDDEKDNHILPECSQAAKGENCLIGSAKESNYMTIVAICKADKHILERARIAGLKGDTLMAAPQICDVAGETYRVKEAVADEDILPGWGKLEKRGPMWEATCAGGYLQAGADILVLAHPQAIKTVQKSIEKLI